MAKALTLAGCGTSQSISAAGITYFSVPCGCLRLAADTANSEVRTRVFPKINYTFSKLYVQIGTNSQTVSFTVSIARYNENLITVTIPALTTGVFRDDVTTASIVPGQPFHYRVVTQAGAGTAWPSLFSVIMESAEPLYFLVVGSFANTVNKNLTRFPPINGRGDVPQSLEVYVKYRLRYNATFSDLEIYIFENTVTATSYARIRVNEVNGNEVATIPASTTGRFSDNVNTDVISSGQYVSRSIVTGSTGTSLKYDVIQSVVRSTGRPIIHASAVGFDEIGFYPLENYYEGTGAESIIRVEARTSFKAKKMFVYTDQVSDFYFRKNGVDTALRINAPGSGEWENTTDEEKVNETDLILWNMDISPSLAYQIGILADPISAPSGNLIAGKLIAAGII